MKKYNKIVEYYNGEVKKCQKVSIGQQEILKQAHEHAEKVINEAMYRLTENLEGKVKDWTSKDYDKFVEMAAHDKRLDGRSILTISTAYARTHDSDKERICNDICKRSYFEMKLQDVNELLSTFRLI